MIYFLLILSAVMTTIAALRNGKHHGGWIVTVSMTIGIFFLWPVIVLDEAIRAIINLRWRRELQRNPPNHIAQEHGDQQAAQGHPVPKNHCGAKDCKIQKPHSHVLDLCKRINERKRG